MHTLSKPVCQTPDDPAVIVGMACRVPGAKNPSQLWDLISQQRDVQKKIPEDRWNVDNFYEPNGAHKGTTNAKYGYFLDQDIGNFDAGFFGISGKEAEAMDPQQRLLLEVVYEALENAGITLAEIEGSQTSVFCGCFTKDYDMMIAKDWDMVSSFLEGIISSNDSGSIRSIL
jgi:acyl transferase domain-containing protein